MEIKEELNLYRKASKRMKYIKQQIAELDDKKYSIGGGSQNLGVQGGQVCIDEKIAVLVDKINTYRQDLVDLDLYCLGIQQDLERKIYKLHEPYCSVLRGYYVESKTLEMLAVEHNYTFDGVKSIKYRGVKLYAKLPPLFDKFYYENNEKI